MEKMKTFLQIFGKLLCTNWKLQISICLMQFRFCSAGSFAGLGFLSLYLSGKIKVFDRKGHVAKLCIIFLPLLAASLVAISRVDDYWHHWNDVFAGGFLGLFLYIFWEKISFIHI